MAIAGIVLKALPYMTPLVCVGAFLALNAWIIAMIVYRKQFLLTITLAVIRIITILFIAVLSQSYVDWMPSEVSLGDGELTTMVCVPVFLAILYYFAQDAAKRLAANAKRPSIVILLDTLLAPLMALKLGPFKTGCDLESCIPAAMKQVKLTEFNFTGMSTDNVFLTRFTTSHTKGKEMSGVEISPAGHLIVQSSHTRRLGERLRLVEYAKKHPNIINTPFKTDPVFVIGFTRTGTTFLHEMLGLHESVKSHHTWEQFATVPNTDRYCI